MLVFEISKDRNFLSPPWDQACFPNVAEVRNLAAPGPQFKKGDALDFNSGFFKNLSKEIHLKILEVSNPHDSTDFHIFDSPQKDP